jgi:plasmid maintenance system antidote protein VapI
LVQPQGYRQWLLGYGRGARRRKRPRATALRLARYFGTSAEFWMNLQSHYDLERRRDEADAEILAHVRVLERVAA